MAAGSRQRNPPSLHFHFVKTPRPSSCMGACASGPSEPPIDYVAYFAQIRENLQLTFGTDMPFLIIEVPDGVYACQLSRVMGFGPMRSFRAAYFYAALPLSLCTGLTVSALLRQSMTGYQRQVRQQIGRSLCGWADAGGRAHRV